MTTRKYQRDSDKKEVTINYYLVEEVISSEILDDIFGEEDLKEQSFLELKMYGIKIEEIFEEYADSCSISSLSINKNKVENLINKMANGVVTSVTAKYIIEDSL